MATQQILRTVALRRKLVKIHESRRLKKAISYFKEDIARHTKSNYDSIRLTGELNGYLMHNVAKNMSNVSVVINKDAGLVKVDLTPEVKKTLIKPVQDKKTEKEKAKDGKATQSSSKSENSKTGAVKEPTKTSKTEKKSITSSKSESNTNT